MIKLGSNGNFHGTTGKFPRKLELSIEVMGIPIIITNYDHIYVGLYISLIDLFKSYCFL
jgi:hypothetical protein